MYLTRWAKLKKDGTVRRGEYATKEKTEFHDALHESCDFAESGEARGILHLIDRTTKTPKWRGYMEKRVEERKAKQEARRRLENAAPELLDALKRIEASGFLDESKGDESGGHLLAEARAAIAKAEEVKP